MYNLIKWVPNDTEGHLVNAYSIERSLGDSENFSKLIDVTKTDTDTETFTDTNLLPSQETYFYRIRALTIDNRRSTPSNALSVQVAELATGTNTRVDIAYADNVIDTTAATQTYFTFDLPSFSQYI